MKKMRQYQPKQERKTYEDVVNAQLKLMELLDDLIKNNKPLKKEEADEFFHTVCTAVYGNGTSENCQITLQNGEEMTFGNIIKCALTLCYQRENTVKQQNENTYKVYETPISKVWEALSDKCKSVFAKAQYDALHTSTEFISKEGKIAKTDAYET